MQFLVMAMIHPETCHDADDSMAKLGFVQQLASDDKRFAFHVPDWVYVSMREGSSADRVRDEVLAELDKRRINAFVVVAEGYACGRV